MIFFQELDSSIHAEEWLIDNILPTESINLLYGEDGQKNAQVALDLALSVANGRDWHSRDVPFRQQVIYITVDGKNKIAKRKNIWHEVNKQCQSTLLASMHDPIDLFDFNQLNQLISDISYCNLSYGRDEYPALVVVDIQGGLTFEPTTSRNANKLINSVGYLRNKMKTAMLLVYNEGSNERCSGFSNLFNIADSVHEVMPVDDVAVRLNCMKIKGFAHPKNMKFDISCVKTSTLGRGK